MNRKRSVFSSVYGLACLLVGCRVHAAVPDSGRPADWRAHDLIVVLTDLPKRYTCDELWYRFHDILLEIGARNIQLLTYQCESALGARARSPRVQLRFDLPHALPTGSSANSELSVVPTTVRLIAGEPRSLDRGDCELVSQIKDTLLQAIGLQVSDSKLDCAAPKSAAGFSLSVQALLPARKNTLARGQGSQTR